MKVVVDRKTGERPSTSDAVNFLMRSAGFPTANAALRELGLPDIERMPRSLRKALLRKRAEPAGPFEIVKPNIEAQPRNNGANGGREIEVAPQTMGAQFNQRSWSGNLNTEAVMKEIEDFVARGQRYSILFKVKGFSSEVNNIGPVFLGYGQMRDRLLYCNNRELAYLVNLHSLTLTKLE